MKAETRKTAAGTEYWDNVEKRVLFVPIGSEPDFEVTENPKKIIAGVDLANGKDMTIGNDKDEETAEERAEREDKEAEQKAKEDEAKQEDVDTQTDINLDKMNVDQLREFAKQNNINLPFNVKKEETIRKIIEDALTAADDE